MQRRLHAMQQSMHRGGEGESALRVCHSVLALLVRSLRVCSCWSRCRSALLGRGFRCRLLSFTRSALGLPFGSAPLFARELRLAVLCAINWRSLCRNELRLLACWRFLFEILQTHDDSGKQLLGLAQLCLQRSNLR